MEFLVTPEVAHVASSWSVSVPGEDLSSFYSAGLRNKMNEVVSTEGGIIDLSKDECFDLAMWLAAAIEQARLGHFLDRAHQLRALCLEVVLTARAAAPGP